MIGLSSLIFAVLEPDRTVIPQEHERETGPRSIEIVFRSVKFIPLSHQCSSFIQYRRVERVGRLLSNDTIKTRERVSNKSLKDTVLHTYAV